MLEGVVECLVKKNKTTGSIVKRFLVIMLDVTLVLGGVVIMFAFPAWFPLYLLVIAAAAVFTYFVFRNTNLEYEYSYFEGEMRVDKIMGKAARKKLNTFDFNKMDLMAPADSPRFYNMQNKKSYDFTTHNPEDTSFGAILYDEKQEQVLLKFTPNEELLAAIQRLAPRKIYQD